MRSTKQINRFIVATYFKHAWKHKVFLFGVFISTILASLTWRFLPPLVVARVLDKLASGNFVSGELWQSFGTDLLLYAALNILGGVLLWRLAIFFIWKLEIRVMQDMHQRIFRHLMSQSATFHANRFGGSLVSQTNKFVGAYIRIADTTIFQVTTMLSSFVFTTIILYPRAPWVAIFVILFAATYMLVAVKITKKVRELNAIEAATSTKQTGFLADAITNIMAVKSFAHSKYENLRYDKATRKTRKATEDVMHASMIRDFFFSSATTTLNTVTLVLAVGAAVLYRADVATVFLVVTYTGVINQYLWDFSQSTLRNYNRALGDAQEMAEILQIQPGVTDPANPEKSHITRGDIVFKDVTFTHSENDDVLFRKLNLHIKPGEKVGLVGHSGSGKTTLTKILLRFNDIDSGAILIDGQNISHLRQEDLRSHISFVPQEPLLFHRSLSENIAYGRPEASQKEIEAIAKMAHAHEFIEQLPKGYETLVGERGVKLSGGQRQRVAIARAMIKNAPILVLDEATSALDSESEVLIQDALWKLMEGRTAIVIAHRLSTIQKMDRIIVMDDGKIVEQGTHKELVGKNGIYADLWSHQSGGFIED